MILFNNAPAFQPIREKLNFKNLFAKVKRGHKRPEVVKDDDADWNRIDSKIKMDEVLSVELQPGESISPDKPEKEEK